MTKPHHKLKKANHGARPANAKARKAKRRRFVPRTPGATNLGRLQRELTSTRAAGTLEVEMFAEVVAKDLILDPASLDFSNIIADQAEIRKYNPQRFEMEQLTAIIYEDLERHVCAGYKDVTLNEFWVRGHMPNMPLMPGVVMLEAAAQMCSYFSQKYDLLGAAMVGFGGLEDVRFRDPVIPGDRLVLMCEMTKLRRGRIVVTKFQGFVRSSMVVEGILKGIPIPIEVVSSQLARAAETESSN